MTEAADLEIRHKRLRIRCWRRGTKEMDLLFGRFADKALGGLDSTALDQFEALLEENDQDLYAWISGQSPMPTAHKEALDRVRVFHGLA